MEGYTKEQLLHLDLPIEFQGNFKRKNNISTIPWDFILLAITILSLLQENKETVANNNL